MKSGSTVGKSIGRAISTKLARAVPIDASPFTSSLPLEITGTPPTSANIGERYSTHVHAACGNGPYHYYVASGELPKGIELHSHSGHITGVPVRVGLHAGIVIRVRDIGHAEAELPAFDIYISAS